MLPATPVEDRLDHRQQPGTARIHHFMLILREKEGPHVDPISSFVDNLHIMSIIGFVKDNIIPAIPNCPEKSTSANVNFSLSFLVNLRQPVIKHISNTIRR